MQISFKDFNQCKKALLDACDQIQDKNALAWSIIDNKSETSVTLALALAMNRMQGRRVAHIEYKHIDLVIADQALVDGGVPVALIEAKAVYLSDFQEKRILKGDWYLGQCVSDDLAKLGKVAPKYPDLLGYAALFYLYEVSDTTRMLKYGSRPSPTIDRAIEAMKGLVGDAKLEEVKMIDCVQADGAQVKIHVCLFVPDHG